MKFDCMVGNPPYQDADGKSSIYPEFVENATDVANTVCMITRDNWLNGMAFEDMREHLLEYGGVTEIKHYPVIGELFENVGVAVAYFLWKRGYNGEANYARIENGIESKPRSVDIRNIITSDMANSIISKINNKGNWGEQFNSRSYPFMDQRKRLSLDTSNEHDAVHDVAIMINKERPVFTSIDNFQNVNEVNKYKVMCGVIINEASENKQGNVLTNIKAIAPMQVASESWSLVATFDSLEEAENCKKYVKTRFFRFLANQTVNNRANVTKNAFRYIPIQDFKPLELQTCNENEKIDWSQSVQNIEKTLYKRYGLTTEEINYIEKTIKAVE